MRRLALAAMAILAACSVKLEGAPCLSDANCPDTQRCDGAGAQPGRCVACETDPACTSDGFACVDLHTIRECRTNAGACHYALSIPCGTLTCGNMPAYGSCPCPANGGELEVDAVQGSALGAPFFPTGISSPAQCRYRRLGDALAAASSGNTVKMTGWTSGTVTFSVAASGEAFPLVVNPGVTLTTTDSPLDPTHYVVEVDQAGAARPVLQLDHDAAASGFTVRPAGSGTASDALFVSCTAGGTAPVTLSNLVLDGKGSLGTSTIAEGLRLSGTCGVSAQSVVVENAAQAGVRVNTSGLTASPPSVSIAGCTMRANGDGGLVVDVDASMGPLSLSVTGNEVALNGAATTFTDGAVTRKGGGVVLRGAVPQSFAFTGNTVHGNSFDQVLVYSSGSWNLSATACGSSSNTFTCYDTQSIGGPWVGLSALGGASVAASNESWAHGTPSAGTDYFRALGSTVNVGTTSCAPTLSCP
jgi:hypothetical protein